MQHSEQDDSFLKKVKKSLFNIQFSSSTNIVTISTSSKNCPCVIAINSTLEFWHISSNKINIPAKKELQNYIEDRADNGTRAGVCETPFCRLFFTVGDLGFLRR